MIPALLRTGATYNTAFFSEESMDAKMDEIGTMELEEQPDAWGALDEQIATEFYPIIPTAFRIFEDRQTGVAPLSRGTAVMLLVVYGCYLYFQLSTHATMYNEPSQKVPKKASGRKESGDVLRGIATMGAGTAAVAGGEINQQHLVHEEEEEEEVPQLTRLGALITLAGSTVLVAFCAEYMVDSIDDLTKGGKVSEEFVGLILLPIVGNAAEHATAVTVAIKDKMDLAIGVAVGSSLQIALLVFPLMVIIGWCGLGQPENMTLNLDGFQVAVLFISIILVNYLIQVSFPTTPFSIQSVTDLYRRMVKVIGSKASCSTSLTSSLLLRLGTIPTPKKAKQELKNIRIPAEVDSPNGRDTPLFFSGACVYPADCIGLDLAEFDLLAKRISGRIFCSCFANVRV